MYVLQKQAPKNDGFLLLNTKDLLASHPKILTLQLKPRIVMAEILVPRKKDLTHKMTSL
jgi:hypothetical protein